MATVDALLAALHDRTREYTSQQQTLPDSSMLGWRRLARNAIRVLVKVDAPTELMPTLRAVHNGDNGRDSHVNAPITAIGYTLGALADTLNTHLDVVAAASLADRSQLRSCVLSSLHDAATATLSGMPPEAASLASRDLLRDLADTTEAASYVPWRTLHAPLGLLSLGPDRGDVDQAVARWAKAANDVLRSPTLVTGYAFQRTAASIAHICNAAGEVFAAVGEGSSRDRAIMGSLTSAFQSWQIAADWPPEVVLGGRSSELRHLSQDLDHTLDEDRILATARPSLTVTMRSALRLAGDVGTCHESALARLVDGRGLWIVARALGPAYLTRHPGVGRSDWIPDPGSAYGSSLLNACHRANTALRQATEWIDQMQPIDSLSRALPRAGWETITARGRTPDGWNAHPSNPRSLDR